MKVRMIRSTEHQILAHDIRQKGKPLPVLQPEERSVPAPG
jgi:hypothetical protein